MSCQNVSASMVLYDAVTGQNVFGASNVEIISFSSSAGLNNSESTLSLTLAINPCFAGTSINLNTGYAVIFESGGFSFGGIVSNIEYTESESGLKYTINIKDPRKLLDLVRLLLSGYYCQLTAPNFINVLNILEGNAAGSACGGISLPGSQLPSIGNCSTFGTSSGTYGRGKSYAQIAAAIASANPVVTTTAGTTLYLDMTAITFAANQVPYATTDGSNMTLSDFITAVCDEAGYDYIVSLVGRYITFVLINRKSPPSFGNISALINTARNSGILVSCSQGLEETYEPTNKVVIGDNIHYIKSGYVRGTTAMFLGYDTAGQPIKAYSAAQLQNGININTTTLSMALSQAGVAFPTMYPIKEAELICAGNIKTWKAYALTHQDSIGYAIGSAIYGSSWSKATILAATAVSQIASQNNQAGNALNSLNGALQIATLPLGGLTTVFEDIGFKWVQQFYQEYYGKKWLVNIGSPICANPAPVGVPYVKGDAGWVKVSDVPTDAGWPDSETVLGLNMFTPDTSLFEADDGRLGGFIAIPANESVTKVGNLFKLNPSLISGPYYQKGNYFYIDAKSPEGYMFSNGNDVEVLIETALIPLTISPPIANAAAGFKALSIICGTDIGTIYNNNASASGSFNAAEFNEFKDLPAAGGFDYACIPMKSNMYVYGPFIGSSGAVGGTTVEEIPDLNPWTYGGVSNMATIGNSLASAGIKALNRSESGSVLLAEAPAYSLGPVLSLGGAVLNSIVVEYGANGVSSKYDFKTFTPKFGNYSKALADRTKQIISLKKDLYKNIKEQRQKNITAISEARKSIFKNKNAFNLLSKPIEPSSSQSATLNMLLYNSYPLQFDIDTANNSSGGSGGSFNQNVSRLTCQDLCQFEFNPNFPSASPGSSNNRMLFNEAGLDKRSAIGHILDPNRYDKYAITSLDALLSPVSLYGSGGLSPIIHGNINQNYQWSNPKPSMPPIWVGSQPVVGILPITQKYLNPMLSYANIGSWDDRAGGTSFGFSIAYVSYGSDPTNLYTPSSNDAKQLESDFRFSALKGPLVLQSWGYDINGKPIPNAVDSPASCENGIFSKEGLYDRFLPNWVSNPKTWPAGPIDLRWDRDRGVWVAPQPEKIVVAQLKEDLEEGGLASAILLNPSSQAGSFYSDYNVYGPLGEHISAQIDGAGINVADFLGRRLCKGTRIYAYHYGEGKYLALEASIVDEATCECICESTPTSSETTTQTTSPTTFTTTQTYTTMTTYTTTETYTTATTYTTSPTYTTTYTTSPTYTTTETYTTAPTYTTTVTYTTNPTMTTYTTIPTYTTNPTQTTSTTTTTTPPCDVCDLAACFSQLGSGGGVLAFDGSCLTLIPTTSCPEQPAP